MEPKTLYALCINKIIESNINIHDNILPADLFFNIKNTKINMECGNVASNLIYILKNSNQYNNLIHAITNKIYLYINAHIYEHSRRSMIKKYGFISNPLMIYYLKQEIGFNE